MKPTQNARSLDAVYEREHFVQFYPQEDSLLENLKRFIGGGVIQGEACVVIATSEHNQALEQLLISAGVGLQEYQTSGSLVMLDARETLSKFMKAGLPDKGLFHELIGGILTEPGVVGRPIRAFGEMVALLWAEDNQAGAVLLEQLWNEASRQHAFTLFCAYPAHHFESQAHASMLESICGLHSSTITSEQTVIA